MRTCQVLRPRRTGASACVGAPAHVAFHVKDRVGVRNRKPFSRLNGWPMRTPVNASPPPSRATAHDSGPLWFATPSVQWTFTIYSSPVSPAHPQLRSRLLHAGQRSRQQNLDLFPSCSPFHNLLLFTFHRFCAGEVAEFRSVFAVDKEDAPADGQDGWPASETCMSFISQKCRDSTLLREAGGLAAAGLKRPTAKDSHLSIFFRALQIIPCAANDLFQLWIPRLPSQLGA